MVVVTTLMPTHKIKDCLSAHIFPSEGGSAALKLALYRFVGACEGSMPVRVVGVAFLCPVRERANGSCDYFDAYA